MFDIGPKDMKKCTECNKRRNHKIKGFLIVTRSIIRSVLPCFTPRLYIGMTDLCLGT